MRFYVFAFTAALGLPHVFLIAMVPVYGMIYILFVKSNFAMQE